MRSIISDQAKQQIRLIAKYIRKEFGKKRRDEFIQGVGSQLTYWRLPTHLLYNGSYCFNKK
jgi:plasmid stabilization system protein ParE